MGTKPEIQSALIGARLRERRRELGHTQEQAAAILGVGQGTVSRVEQGQSRFSLDLVAPIAAYLGVDVSVLVDTWTRHRPGPCSRIVPEPYLLRTISGPHQPVDIWHMMHE